MDRVQLPADAFAMPLTSPSFPPGPYRFSHREHMTITYRTDPEALAAVVPEPLQYDQPLVRCEFMTMHGSTGFGRYSGAAQHIPVRLGEQMGTYTHAMFLDTYAPISGGRELWGFPQKLATPALVVARDTLLGTLDYGPARLATGTMGYKHRRLDEAQARVLLAEPGFLLKIIPHVDGSARICELVRYYRRDIVIREAWTGPCALALASHALAPLNDLPVREVIGATHVVADFTLELGEVVHDYLA